jgi:hypothetical protein
MTLSRLSRFVFFLALTSLVTFISLPIDQAWAQSPCPDPGKFGCFEILDQLPPIGGITIDKVIDEFIQSQERPLVTIANIIFQIGLAILIMVGLLCVVVGGYLYMTAGGSSEQIGTAKKWIGAALIGVTIGLVGWLILNTVSPQFTEPGEPTLILPSPTI